VGSRANDTEERVHFTTGSRADSILSRNGVVLVLEIVSESSPVASTSSESDMLGQILGLFYDKLRQCTCTNCFYHLYCGTIILGIYSDDWR
jgi:hypothetical protein